MKKNVFSLLIVITLGISCDKHKLYEEFQPVDGQKWNYEDIKHFNINIADSSAAYQTFICIRNSAKYAYSNLFLFVTVHSPLENTVRDTIEITLADERGKWLGKGAANLYTIYNPLNIKFTTPGIYIIDIEHAMWVKDLENIHDVGIRIEKPREKQ